MMLEATFKSFYAANGCAADMTSFLDKNVLDVVL